MVPGCLVDVIQFDSIEHSITHLCVSGFSGTRVKVGGGGSSNEIPLA